MREMKKLELMDDDGSLYYDVQKDMMEALLPNPYISCHAPGLLELANGDLLCCWFAGTEEGNKDISIMMSRLNANQSKWTKPELISDDPTRSEQNPSFFSHPNGDIWMIYTAQKEQRKNLPANSNMQYTSEIRMRSSSDNGVTWGPRKVLFNEPGSFCRQKIQILSNGRWIFGTWKCFDDETKNGTDISIVMVSDDQGQNWKAVYVPDSIGCVHCNLVERENGKILAFFRSRAADFIYISYSYDYGDTFSIPEKTVLPNNNASISAINLKSGAIAIVYNECGFADNRSITKWPKQRSPLCIALSDDEGNTWDYRRIIDISDGYCGKLNSVNNIRCEYPVIIQGVDERIHVAYTWGNRKNIKYVSFTEEWVRGKRTLDEGLKYIY